MGLGFFGRLLEGIEFFDDMRDGVMIMQVAGKENNFFVRISKQDGYVGAIKNWRIWRKNWVVAQSWLETKLAFRG